LDGNPTLHTPAGDRVSIREALAAGALLLVFLDGAEPSQRMAPQITAALSGNAPVQVWWVAGGAGEAVPAAPSQARALSADAAELASLKLATAEEPARVSAAPVIVLLGADGKTLLWQQGYNLLIGDILQAALGRLPAPAAPEPRGHRPAHRR
jgi:hypothetical protein